MAITQDLEVSVTVAIVTGFIAAFGYVGKLVFEGTLRSRALHRERRSKMVALQSLLLASWRVFEIQNGHVQSLCAELSKIYPEFSHATYDEILAAGFPRMDERQKLVHGLVRAYTIDAMRPLNLAMIEWLASDTHFKGGGDELASDLQSLEAHLLLWRAKYEFWIPPNPERAIVYMLDEGNHGVGFPKGIEQRVAQVTRIPAKGL